MTAKLLDLLQSDLQNTELLADLLARERLQLEQRQFADLPHMLRQKAELLAALERNAQARQALLLGTGLADTAEGMSILCEQLDTEGEARQHAESFRELQQRLHHCQQENLVNAAVVHRSRLNTGKLLNILKGRETVAGLYSPLGAPESGEGDSRTLGSA